eukprot:CAMPEP_0178435790 /NCGR_PEP_ID=MMETSP0689_2-20121128/34110_1 /TAXON_ID=160604 /ORGANISM="Amphidinium massartii, Strain CS-259" /LENGTH=1037 /DNA_ID=CAMNT_0020057875 /DNA_START=36 /DNA_END=3146 /DNA_ORIENTATION=-
MEDLASEFTEGFLEAIKVLEEFSTSDGDLREVFQELRRRVNIKKYTCAPDFWDDLRATLAGVARAATNPAKAQQVMKQIDRLEVQFWAKESVSMLSEMEPDFRLERMVDWVHTFDAGATGDAQSGPAVLYRVLTDVTLQKEMTSMQRDALIAAVRENLHKFPIEMQEPLKRVGSTVQSSAAGGVADWRRRQALGAQDVIRNLLAAQAAGAGGANSAVSSTAPGAPASDGAEAARSQSNPEAGVPSDVVGFAASGRVLERVEHEDEAAHHPQFDMSKVDPEHLLKARNAVVAILVTNAGCCEKQFIRNLLDQLGVAGLPISALGEEVFASATEVYLRKAPVAPAAAPQAGYSAVPDDLKQLMVACVQEAGGRLQLAQLMEQLQWHHGSVRYQMHGPLKRALSQVGELFFEPNKVFTIAEARRHIAIFGEATEEAAEDTAVVAETPEISAHIVDPFAELVATIRAWLDQGGGALRQDAVLPLIKAMGFKPKAVINALASEVYWCHQEAECEILLRTAAGAAQHPRPHPDVYLDQHLRQSIIREVKDMGAKAKLDKLTGSLKWNKNSLLAKTCGSLPVVLQGVREIFFEPSYLYLKRSLDGIVQWPVTKDGRQGPDPKEITAVHWTREVDDLKAAGDPEFLNFKRQLIGTMMANGGRCEVQLVQQCLLQLNQQLAGEEPDDDREAIDLESLFMPGSKHDLSRALFWGQDSIFRWNPDAIASRTALEPVRSEELGLALAKLVRIHGKIPRDEVRAALQQLGFTSEVSEDDLSHALRHTPEVFYMPEMVFLHYTAQLLVLETPEEVADSGEFGNEGLDASAETGGEAKVADAEYHKFISNVEAIEAGEAFIASVKAAEGPLEATEAETVIPAATEAQPAMAPEGAAAAPGFFSFDAFAPEPQASPVLLESPAKRLRLEEPRSRALAWEEETALPAWATEGAAVVVRSSNDVSAKLAKDIGVIVRPGGVACVIRSLAGAGLDRGLAGGGLRMEREVPTSRLLPLPPEVGNMVKVVEGPRSGCYGTLTGLAGSDGIVQIGKMSF